MNNFQAWKTYLQIQDFLDLFFVYNRNVCCFWLRLHKCVRSWLFRIGSIEQKHVKKFLQKLSRLQIFQNKTLNRKTRWLIVANSAGVNRTDPCENHTCENNASCTRINNEHYECNCFAGFSGSLTLTRPIGLPPHAPVAQKIADQCWLIASSAKYRYLFYKMM